MRLHLLFGSFHPAVFHGWMDSGRFEHQVISALIHSAIYVAMCPFFRGLGWFGSIMAGVIILAASWLVYRFLSRS